MRTPFVEFCPNQYIFVSNNYILGSAIIPVISQTHHDVQANMNIITLQAFSYLRSLHLVSQVRGCLVPSHLHDRSAPPGAASVTPSRRLSVPSPTGGLGVVLAGW